MMSCLPRHLRLLGLLLVVSLILVPVADAGEACPESCPGDLNGNGVVTIDELVRSVNAALTGCGEPGETRSTLLQTGQTRCDQGSGALGQCPGSPAGQDGAIEAGRQFSYTDKGDGTITDNVTGLMWEKLSDDNGIHDWEAAYTWRNAFDVKIAALNTPPCFTGHCDWRLPNLRELQSLMHAGQRAPAIDPIFNSGCEPGCTPTTCSCTQLDFYWSSTNFEDLSNFAWCADANLGFLNGFEKIPDIKLYVRAVRGGL